MERKITRIIDNGSGIGKLFADSELIDDVSYQFQITQEFIMYESASGKQTIPGIKDLSGNIHLNNKAVNLSGNYYKLILSDNKEWNIAVVNGGYLTRDYRFVSAPGNENI